MNLFGRDFQLSYSRLLCQDDVCYRDSWGLCSGVPEVGRDRKDFARVDVLLDPWLQHINALETHHVRTRMFSK